MIAAVVNTGQLLKVVVYSLVAGVGVSAVFALGVSSASALIDALRTRRTGTTFMWGTVAVACTAATIAAVVFGLVVMASK